MTKSRRPSRYDGIATDPETGRPLLSHVEGADSGPLESDVAALRIRLGPLSTEWEDASFLATLPNLAEPFLAALTQAVWSDGRASKRTKRTLIDKVKNGFVEFLTTTERTQIGVPGITTPLVNEYFAWLHRTDQTGNPVWRAATRRRYYQALGIIIGELKKRSTWAEQLPKNLQVRTKAFPDAHHENTPTQILSDSDWLALVAIVEAEVHETIRSVTNVWAHLEANQDLVPEHSGRGSPYHDRTVLLATLATTFPRVVPSLPKIRLVNHQLANALQYIHGTRVLTALQPTPRDLLPFVLLLAIYTQFNSDPLLGLTFSEISHEVVLGAERLVLSPFKERSGRAQRRTFAIDSSPVSPARLIEFITRWTSRIRPAVAERHADRLFLFVPITGTEPRSYDDEKSGPSGDQNWKYHLRSWSQNHGLPATTIQVVRTTGLDWVDDLFGGDLRAVQAAGGQRSQETIRTHYHGDAAKKRDDERMADVGMTRERWLSSGGRIDPRGQPGDQDLGAATPGWVCMDPMDSPIPGEDGRLCMAFGQCPGCSLGATDVSSPYALACHLQLRDELEAAQLSLGADRWVAAYARPMSQLTTFWLPQYTAPDVIAAAAKLVLPPLPPVE